MGISGEQNDLVRLVLLLPDGVTICMGGKISRISRGIASHSHFQIAIAAVTR